MKFGKEFRIHLEETLPEWRDKFLCYKPLKKLLKHFPATATAVHSLPPQLAFYLHPHLQPPTHINHHAVDPTTSHLMDLQGWFVRILNEELDKFNDFYVDKEEEFVIRFQVRFFLNCRMHICVFVCKILFMSNEMGPCEMGCF